MRTTPLSHGLPVDRNDLIEATTVFLRLGTHSVLTQEQTAVLGTCSGALKENIFIVFTQCVLLYKRRYT